MSRKTSLPKICIALGFSEVDTLWKHARREVESGETFLEFRIDYLSNPLDGVHAIERFTRQFPECTLLATCRRHQNHGRFNGSVDEQIRLLDLAIDAGARAFDIEIESAEAAPAAVERLRSKAWAILSFHHWGGTPAVEPILRRMTRIPADGYKVVTTARKPSDNLRVLSLARTNPRTPLVMLAMGEPGLATRVLSPAFGAIYTYAAPNAAEGTAPGQISARVLRNIYHADKVTKAAKIYGVIADPVRHSISPAVHNRAFHSRRIDAVYLPFLVHAAQLKDFFILGAKLPLSGFSVTIPHKQKILRYLDGIDPLARRIGAVNTVTRRAGKWRGSNTDVEGVLTPLRKLITPAKSSVLVAGNGGAARGAAFALVEAGAKVSIVGRNPDRVRALAKACGATAVTREQVDSLYYDALIHATPVGMHPNVDDSFFPDRIPADIVFDMVYNPLETRLIRQAAASGKKVIPGHEMFIEQAVRQFELWTNETAPRAAMEKAALEALQARAEPIIEAK